MMQDIRVTARPNRCLVSHPVRPLSLFFIILRFSPRPPPPLPGLVLPSLWPFSRSIGSRARTRERTHRAYYSRLARIDRTRAPSTSPDRQFGGTPISHDDARTCMCVFLARLLPRRQRLPSLANRSREQIASDSLGRLLCPGTSTREQSRYRGNVINPLAAGMYKSIGEPAVSSDFAVSVIKFVEANCVCEAWMKFPLGRRFLLFQISEVRYATIISISLTK